MHESSVAPAQLRAGRALLEFAGYGGTQNDLVRRSGIKRSSNDRRRHPKTGLSSEVSPFAAEPPSPPHAGMFK